LNEYLDRCSREGWIDSARLPDSCTELVSSIVARPKFPRSLCFAGFSEVTPQQQSLLEQLAMSGVETSRWAPQGAPRTLIAHAFSNTPEELTAAALWARRRLESDAASRIGVVVPDMTRHRQTVGRIFEDLLSPASVLPGRAGQLSPYNLSLGTSLLEYPLVHTAMSILEFFDETISYRVVGHLLRSPFLRGGESEAEQRAILDASARRLGPVNWRLPEFHQFATTQAAKADRGCQILRDVLERLEHVRRNAPRRALPSEWSILFRQMLLCAGWPGERALDSAEYQTVEQINRLFAHLASLDAMLGATNCAVALKALRGIAVDTVYQPEAHESRLVVMGALEASGSTFDSLWITGLHDRDWPPPPSPSPFLPVAVQRRYGLPHSSPDREREFAAVTLAYLLAAAGEAVVSCGWNPPLGNRRLSTIAGSLLHGNGRRFAPIRARSSRRLSSRAEARS
jgi:probable DNA repair protein